ncbi:hypothetical protein BHYA_0307g00060 [Botrytis hyacinthi]|uniref:Uncharacterized protein n=1 Tax=Botrytis hyacinthi TaxID=278943 RepID=A0A4Z1GEZ9_9HELO|nr:hypothetical protein BHYA_0307g00060 [Botrytis hyacinthi]
MSALSKEFHPARRLKWTSNELGSPKLRRVAVHIVVICSNPRSLGQSYQVQELEYVNDAVLCLKLVLRKGEKWNAWKKLGKS